MSRAASEEECDHDEEAVEMTSLSSSSNNSSSSPVQSPHLQNEDDDNEVGRNRIVASFCFVLEILIVVVAIVPLFIFLGIWWALSKIGKAIQHHMARANNTRTTTVPLENDPEHANEAVASQSTEGDENLERTLEIFEILQLWTSLVEAIQEAVVSSVEEQTIRTAEEIERSLPTRILLTIQKDVENDRDDDEQDIIWRDQPDGTLECVCREENLHQVFSPATPPSVVGSGGPAMVKCEICLGDYKVNDAVSWSNNHGGCQHAFHQSCIVGWLEKHTSCPMCRRDFWIENGEIETDEGAVSDGAVGRQSEDVEEDCMEDGTETCCSVGPRDDEVRENDLVSPPHLSSLCFVIPSFNINGVVQTTAFGSHHHHRSDLNLSVPVQILCSGASFAMKPKTCRVPFIFCLMASSLLSDKYGAAFQFSSFPLRLSKPRSTSQFRLARPSLLQCPQDPRPTRLQLTSPSIDANNSSERSSPALLNKMTIRDRRIVQLKTFLRVSIPSVFAGIVATVLFPAISLQLAGGVAASAPEAAGALAVLAQDSSQFVQNFQTVASLLFSILVGQTFTFLYTQQESIYYALFNEVTEAKSLLEQVALVCQGRSMYQRCLESISRYVNDDLKNIESDPAVLLSARPVDDPLESIMYMTSVGVPSSVYETVKSLREARADRLGALQRKLPTVHMALLWILALTLMCSFPLLGAGTQTVGGYKILTIEGVLFGVMTAGIVLTMRVVGELWRPTGGAYNVDSVLSVMVSGLEEELQARQKGGGNNLFSAAASRMAPSGVRDQVGTDPSRTASSTRDIQSEGRPVQQQGADIGATVRRVYEWFRRRQQRRSRARR